LVLHLFAQGLPRSLAKSCINIELPENFEQWTSTAQRQHRNWLRKQGEKEKGKKEKGEEKKGEKEEGEEEKGEKEEGEKEEGKEEKGK
jgi:hypothetical protein